MITYWRGRCRRGLPGVEGDGPAGGGVPDDDEGAPAGTARHRVHHAEAERGGHGGVHRVPARAQRRGAHLRAPRVVRRRRADPGLHLVPVPPRAGDRGTAGSASASASASIPGAQEQQDARQDQERRGDGQRGPRAAAAPAPPGTGRVVVLLRGRSGGPEERALQTPSALGHG